MSTIKTVCPCCSELIDTQTSSLFGRGTAVRYIVCQKCESDGLDTAAIADGEGVVEAFDDPSTAWTDATLIDALATLVTAFKTVLSHSDVMWTPFTEDGDDG